MLQSIMNTKEALQEFADRIDVDFPPKANVQLSSFQFAIQELLDLLELIYKAQKMSKDDKANISYIYKRQKDIELYLQSYSRRLTLQAANIKAYLETKPVFNIKLSGINKKNQTRQFNK